MEPSHPGTHFDALTRLRSPPELAAQSSLSSKGRNPSRHVLVTSTTFCPGKHIPRRCCPVGRVASQPPLSIFTGAPAPNLPHPLSPHRVEDSTGLAGTEVDVEGYAEASEGHVPQGKPQFQSLIILKPSLGWTCGRGFGQVDMICNGGTRESSDRLALLRPSKCPTARTDQYPTGQ
uniref:Uncharacterized protein n=1 Tax=Oryza nivara TaxID=4536 RepID=A0A0E0J933_ORYNI